MDFDIRTLILILGISHLMQVLVFYHQYKVNKAYKGIGWWLMWSAAESIGFLTILFRENSSVLPVLIIVQNTAIVSGTLFIYIGVLRFFGKKENLKIILPFIALYLSTLLFFIFVYDDIQIRSGITNAVLGGVAIITAISLYKNKTRSISSTVNFNTVIFILHGSIFIYRSVKIFSGTSLSDMFTPTMFNIIPFFDALIVSLLWTFGFIIMVNQRLNSEMTEAKEHFEQIFNTSPDAAIITRLKDGLIVNWNNSYNKIAGYVKEDMYGKTSLDINLWKNPDDRQAVVRKLTETGFCENYEAEFKLKDGSEITGLMSAKIITLHDEPHIISITRDITEIKKAEEKLRKSEIEYRSLFENMAEGVALHELVYDADNNPSDYRIIDVNNAYRKQTGLESELVIDRLGSEVYGVPYPPYLKEFAGVAETGEQFSFETYFEPLQKHFYISVISPARGQFATVFLDMSAQKKAEEKILKANRMYFFISQINQAIVRLRNKEELFDEACRIAIEFGKFRMAWFGITDEDTMLVIPVAFAGAEDGYLSKIKRISVSDQAEGRGPTGTAIREGKHFICHDILNDPLMSPWKDEASLRGYRSSIALPVIISGKVIGAFSLYSDTAYFFDKEETELLDEVAGDISFAIEAIETEKKRLLAENELRESEERFKNIFEHAAVGKSITSMDGSILVNKAFCDITGYSKDELAKIKWQDITHPDDVERDSKIIKTLVNGEKESARWIKRYIHKNGNVVWIDISSVLQKDSIGNPLHFITTITDITDQKHSEEKIDKAGKYYQALIEKASDGIVLLNGEGHFKYISPCSLKLFGYSESCEISGNPADYTHPDDLPMVLQHLMLLLKDETYVPTLQYRFLEKNGNWKWIESVFSNLLSDPNVESIVLNVRDISERKKAEEAMNEMRLFNENLIQTANTLIVSLDVSGKLTIFNSTAEKITGYKREELEGKNWFEVIVPRDKYSYVWDEFVRLSEGGIPAAFENPILTKTGEERIIAWSNSMIESNGKISGTVSFGIDITGRKLIEEELYKLNDELEQRVTERTSQLERANKELEAFSYTVSHDLRAPLRAIDGLSLALYDDYYKNLDDDAKDYISRIRSATTKMDRLIDSLLKLSRVSRLELKTETVNLSLIAKEISDSLKKNDKGREADFIIQGNLSADGDANLLRIVLENLLNNAWKFTAKKDKAVIEFGAVKKGEKTEYYVRDNGAGFDMKYAGKLFGAFQRLHPEKDYPGTGIGLVTVQRIISRHNGDIRAEGKLNEGSVFNFTIG